ncbi:MAG: ATP-binding protein [Thermodesulfobacteriota bacterium]
MSQVRLLRRLLLVQLLAALLFLTLLLGFLSRTWSAAQGRLVQEDLEVRARLVVDTIRSMLPEAAGRLQAFVRDTGQAADTRLTVVAPDGTVLADTWEAPERMESHADREEVARALAGQVAFARRYSFTLHTEVVYLAMPLTRDGQVLAVLRAARPALPLDHDLTAVRLVFLIAGLAFMLLVAAATLLATRRLRRSLRTLEEGAARFAAGDLALPLSVVEEELQGLAAAMNRMAQELAGRIRAALREKNELEALFASMLEGVIVLDQEGRIQRVNDAAIRLLGLDSRRSLVGRQVLEVIRHRQLERLAGETLTRDSPVAGEVTLPGGPGGDRFLAVHGVHLLDEDGLPRGGLVVLHDVSHIRRLETVRRDFVANVSHELKTPITSIKGFVETLLAGAMEEPENGRRFLEIVGRQADRLSDIVDDLLVLARLEADAEAGGFTLAPHPLAPVLEAAQAAVSLRTAEKGITVETDCPPDLAARINPPLLEQVVVNLLDNAVKYSGNDTTIWMEAYASGEEVVIAVIDQGPGIAAEHLPRLFERFYRAEKARSRKKGGTGLGLAIVRHIVTAHGGQVKVQSAPGRGSVFSVHLPRVAGIEAAPAGPATGA